MRYSVVIIFCYLCCFPVSSQPPDSSKFQSLEPYDFHLQYLRHDSALLIDVRESFEFRGRRIHDALNFPSSANLDLLADTINKNYALFLYCTTDYRSIRVAEKLYDKGFRKLYSLEGGIVAWRKDGFPVDKNRVKRKKK